MKRQRTGHDERQYRNENEHAIGNRIDQCAPPAGPLSPARNPPVEKIGQTTETASVEATLANEAICQVNGVNTGGTCNSTPITASDVTVTWSLECTNSGGSTTTQSTSISSISVPS